MTRHGATVDAIETLTDGPVGRGAPLRILGGTGSPLNPVAVL